MGPLEDHYCLVNPSTRESRRLPLLFVHNTKFRFGYDSKTDDYKVMTISTDRESVVNVVSVYSLRTDSWKRIKESPYGPSGIVRPSGIVHRSGVLVSGALHWLAETSTGGIIMALDLEDEKFRTFPGFPYTGFIDIELELLVLGGCLCVSGRRFYGGSADFWVMKEYGVNDSWTKFTVTNVHCYWIWKPLSLSRTGQVLFQGFQGNAAQGRFPRCYESLLLFDQQVGNSWRVGVHDLPTPFEAENYVESLVSPNRQ